MDSRQSKLLITIIDQFIKTAVPVGSRQLLETGSFLLSGATIRNEMRDLGDEGYLEQPHISAGRVPTAKGYRVYVKEFMEPSAAERQVRRKFEQLREQYVQRKDQERAYEAVALLSQMIPNIAFATAPHKPRMYYLGLAHALRQPEFLMNPRLATGVLETLEERLSSILEEVELDEKVRYYIGDEHILAHLQSCSLMVTAYRLRPGRVGEQEWHGAIGIIGPMRMDYAYDTVALELVADLLRSA